MNTLFGNSCSRSTPRTLVGRASAPHGATPVVQAIAAIILPGVLWTSAGTSVASTPPVPRPSAEGTLTCSNLDVVFIVDQSDSMGGFAGVRATDPTNQRENAPKAMVDLLSDIALDICPDAHHRMAVISYGSNARVDLPLSDIAPDSFAEAQALREALKENISAAEMGQTNPKAAFELAVRVLDDAAPAGTGIRKRVIIFITDGHPCVTALGCTPPNSTMDFVAYAREMRDGVSESLPFDRALLKQEECIGRLREELGGADEIPAAEVNTCLVEHPVEETTYSRSTYIFTILLNFGEAYSKRLRDAYVDMSESHAGRVIDLSENRKDIPTTFNQILTQLAGVKATRLRCGKFAVNPYLKSARIVLFKTDESITIRLSYVDTNGETHQIEGGQTGETGGFTVAEYYPYGTNERYVFTTPYPGIWNLESSNCEEFDAYYDGILVNPGGYRSDLPAIPQYDREPYYDAERPYYIKYQMRDEAGDVVPQAGPERFAVYIVVTVTDPNGERRDYGMEYNPDEQLFQSTEPLQVRVPGIYQISFVGTTFEHAGEPLLTGPETDNYTRVFDAERELFRNENVEFTVFPVSAFKIEVLSPRAGEMLSPIHGSLLDGWPLPVHPIEVEAQITGLDQPLPDLREVLTDFQTPLTAVAVSAGGEESSEIPLTPDPNTPGRYTGTIEGFDVPGNQTLVVELQSGFNDHYRPLNTDAEVTFTRTDNLVNLAIFYFAVLALLILIATAIVTHQILIRTNKVTGRLVFEDGPATIAVFELGRGLNWRKITSRELGPYPALQLRRLRVVNRGRPTKQVSDQPFDPATGQAISGSSHLGVRVTGLTRAGKRIDRKLDPNSPDTYSDETHITMKFESYTE